MAASTTPDETADSARSSSGYTGYAKWKGWRGAFTVEPRQARYFAAEFHDIPLAGRRVLEIGFGDGSFLAWARSQDAEVRGIELNAELCEAGRRAGFDVTTATLAELAQERTGFDAIVAIDVLEHWSSAELIAACALLPALLTDGGVLVARFPNGQSPFGRIYQHGDFTHQTTLSTFKIEYLASLSGLEVVRIDNACRAATHAGILRKLRHRLRAWQRRRIERWVARLYGIRPLPLDPNLVAVLRKCPMSQRDSIAKETNRK